MINRFVEVVYRQCSLSKVLKLADCGSVKVLFCLTHSYVLQIRSYHVVNPVKIIHNIINFTKGSTRSKELL